MDLSKQAKKLIQALYKNSTELVVEALQEGASPETMFIPGHSDYRTSAIHFAAMKCSRQVTEELVKGGGSIELKDEEDCTPLHRASRYGNLSAVKYLLDRGADLYALNYRNKTPLQLALLAGKVDVMDEFKRHGVDINKKDAHGNTYLHHALVHGRSVDMIRWLLRNGASVTVRNDLGRTAKDVAEAFGFDPRLVKVLDGTKEVPWFIPLFKIPVSVFLLDGIHYGNLGMVRRALREGASANLMVPPERWFGIKINVLCWAIRKCDQEIVEELLNWGADINAASSVGNTPLHHACIRQDLGIIEFLLRRGVLLNLKNDEGQTPIYFAVAGGTLTDLECFRLDKQGLNEADDQCNTPLHIALAFGSTQMAWWLLLQQEVDVTVKNNLGRTPKDVAEDAGYDAEMIQALAEADCHKIEPLSKKTAVPLNLAVCNAISCNNLLNAVLALEAGANPSAMVPPERVNNIQRTSVFHLACRDSSLRMVETLIDRGADIEVEDELGHTPLFGAVECFSTNHIRCLLTHGANALHKKGENLSPLELAVVTNFDKAVKIFIEEFGIDVNKQDEYGNTLLHLAVANGSTRVAHWLLKFGTVISARNVWGRTAQDVARGLQYDKEVVRILGDVDRIGDVSSYQVFAQMALLCGIRCNNLDKVRQALHDGASPNIMIPPELLFSKGMSVLCYAVHRDQKENMEELLKWGADINAASGKNDNTALHYACIKQNLVIIEELLKRGASPSTRNCNGRTPIYYAVSGSTLSDLECFGLSSQELNEVDDEGNTLLHQALAHNNVGMAWWLLQQEVDLTVRNKLSRSPKDVAEDAGFDSEMIWALAEADRQKKPTSSAELVSLQSLDLD